MSIKRIGLLTSGGDCAGLNAVLKAATFRAIYGYGWEVFGIKHGPMGLLERPPEYQKLDLSSFERGVMRMGGTILGTTNRNNPFSYVMENGVKKDRSDEIIQGIKMLQLDALIGIGGDGSQKMSRTFCERGKIPYIAIPKTIDNDIPVTERSIGFSTAVDVATEALDRLQPTAASHDRVMILEVMGRDAGHIALSAGIAGDADIILIPELPYKLSSIKQKIDELNTRGRNFALIVVAEAVKTEGGESIELVDPNSGLKRYGGIGHYLADRITEMTGAETRFMVLGHVQRGGEPNSSDRVLASAFGVHAVDLIAKGRFDRMVVWQNRQVVDVPIMDAIKDYGKVDPQDTLIRTAKSLGIYIGEIC